MVVTFVFGGGAGAGAAAVAGGGGGRCHAEDPGNGSRRCPIQGPVLLQRCNYTATWYQTAPAAAKAMQGDWQLAVSVSPEVRKTKARIWGWFPRTQHYSVSTLRGSYGRC